VVGIYAKIFEAAVWAVFWQIRTFGTITAK